MGQSSPGNPQCSCASLAYTQLEMAQVVAFPPETTLAPVECSLAVSVCNNRRWWSARDQQRFASSATPGSASESPPETSPEIGVCRRGRDRSRRRGSIGRPDLNRIQSVDEPLALGLGIAGAEASGSVAPVVLDHHVVEVLVVGDGDESVEIFAGELVLETNGIVRGVAEGGELGDESGELDIAIDCEDFGVTADVGELVVVGAGLDFAAVAAHELDFVAGGGGGGLVVP
ncbi:unnamed protein product [Malus baccata var. baccata]